MSDIAIVRPADRVLLEGELAQGGIPRSSVSREALKAAGVGLLVSPRLERIGDALQIRADAYDLANGAVAGSGTAAIPSSLAAELERALGAGTTSATPAARTSGQWSSVYDAVKSGVVKISSSQKAGSGFVIRGDGLILTNEHVVRGAKEPLTVTPEGGSPLPARVVSSDAFWDLAAIQVDGLPKGCHVFTFADDVSVSSARWGMSSLRRKNQRARRLTRTTRKIQTFRPKTTAKSPSLKNPSPT